MSDVKMVLVMRTKFPDGKGGLFGPRKGKLIAQGAHAVSEFLIEKINKRQRWTLVEAEWLVTGRTKVCVGVESEEELLDIFRKASDTGLLVHLITDAGRTEFDGPTKTCLAIGPAKSSDIDKITGNLKLL